MCNWAYQADKNYDNFDVEPFAPSLVITAFIVKKQELQKLETSISIRFLDLYVSQYLCNNYRLFNNTKTKNINFIMTVGQIIQTKEISTISILLISGNNIKLQNITLIPNCNSNLISLE